MSRRHLPQHLILRRGRLAAAEVIEYFRSDFDILEATDPPLVPDRSKRKLKKIRPQLEKDIAVIMQSPEFDEKDYVGYLLELRVVEDVLGRRRIKLVIQCRSSVLLDCLEDKLWKRSPKLRHGGFGKPVFELLQFTADQDTLESNRDSESGDDDMILDSDSGEDENMSYSESVEDDSILGSILYIPEELYPRGRGWRVTVGGVVMVNGVPHGLTVGHYRMLPSVWLFNEEEHRNSLHEVGSLPKDDPLRNEEGPPPNEGSLPPTTDGPSSHEERPLSDDQEPPPNEGSLPPTTSSHEERSLSDDEQPPPNEKRTFHGEVLSEIFASNDSFGNGSDWALVKMIRPASISNCLSLPPSDLHKIPTGRCLVDEIVDIPRFTALAGDRPRLRCLVATYSGLMPALVYVETSLMVLNEGSFQILKVRLQKPLRMFSCPQHPYLGSTFLISCSSTGLLRLMGHFGKSVVGDNHCHTGRRKVRLCYPDRGHVSQHSEKNERCGNTPAF